ncbi:hypothetical protein BCV69DRAFT_283433 [Microstroma glucosiphilum]|uniref:Uncharacterized protein n=1 Tax=Pseudomicrostroma glucosiphilum TaxID=1684307 RepID=A0A316U3M1_9BASI|nr:hypothetical protein BCV69DRAFT_283433 [Pseudomicrostroma glucosiphilum]PWN19902.1 hypothetical protein BCV69DRAFT_283433 [Pseudomicrostroma glucosiphilum]
MRPFSSLLAFALIAALTTALTQALPANPTQPQKPLAVDALVPRFAASIPISDARAPKLDVRPDVLRPRATEALSVPVNDRGEVVSLTGESADLAERKEHSVICDARHLYKRLLALKLKIALIKVRIQAYFSGEVSTHKIIKELHAVIHEIKETTAILKIYQSRGVFFDYAVTAEFGVGFKVLMDDIFIGLHDICAYVSASDLAIDGVLLTTLNDLVYHTSEFLSIFGCVVLGFFNYIWAPLAGFFHVCISLGLNLSPCEPLLSPIGLGGLIWGHL